MGEVKKWKLNNSVTGVIQVMLDELVARQRKFKRLEKAKNRWSFVVLFCLAVFLFFGYDLMSLGLQGNILSVIIGNVHLLLLIVVLSIGLTQVRHFEKKSKKAEKEFDELREELIDRSSELWSEDVEWKLRQDVFEFMKKEFDINLFYK